MAEILKSWLVEFKIIIMPVRFDTVSTNKKIRLAFGTAEKHCRICPYCKDTRPISADGVRLGDRFCPNCGKAVKVKEEK